MSTGNWTLYIFKPNLSVLGSILNWHTITVNLFAIIYGSHAHLGQLICCNLNFIGYLLNPKWYIFHYFDMETLIGFPNFVILLVLLLYVEKNHFTISLQKMKFMSSNLVQ